MPLELFKLEKLRVTAYKDVERSQSVGPAFEVMFNPSSWSQSQSISYSPKQGINTSGAQIRYSKSDPASVKLDLVFDGLNVHGVGDSTPRVNVRQRVQTFLELTWQYNGAIHEPNYLIVEWGAFKFSCRLVDASVSYTLFDRDGTPLRAALGITLIEDLASRKRAQTENKRSPDLTHARTVRSGDTLPLLTYEIYGSSAAYLDVARFNQLDDFRNLVPGQQLLFPPLVTFTAGTEPKEG